MRIILLKIFTFLLILPICLLSQDYNIVWERLYDGFPDFEARAEPFGLIEADDGGLIIGVVAFESRIRIFKVNRDGEIIWDFYRALRSNNASPGLIKMESGEIILFAHDSEDHRNDYYLLIALNEDGEDDDRVLWERTYNFVNQEIAESQYVTSVFPAGQNQVAMLGKLSRRHGRNWRYHEFLTLFDNEGDTLYTREYNWVDRPDWIFSIEDGCYSNDNFVFTGFRTVYRFPQPSPPTGILFSTDMEFDSLTWEEFLPDFLCMGKRIINLPDDNFLICGEHLVSVENRPGWYLNGFAAKFDGEWNYLWHRVFEPEFSFSNSVIDAVHLGHGNIMISTEWCAYGAWLLVMNSDGEILDEIIDDEQYATFHRIMVTQQSEIYAVGTTRQEYRDEENRVRLARIVDADNVVSYSDLKRLSQFTLFPAYPNPFNSSFVIPFNLDVQSDVSIKLLDISGRELFDVSMDNMALGNHTFPVNTHRIIGGLPSGSYLINIRSEERSLMRRITHIE